MPHQARSHRLTSVYRQRLLRMANAAEQAARVVWPTIPELDATDWPERAAGLASAAQTRAVRLTAGYVAAYLRSETGKGTVPALDARKYVGISRAAKPLSEAFESPIIGVKVALKEGRSADEALKLNLVRALRSVNFEVVQAGRDALLDAIEADDRFEGWQRSVAGTCAACEALSGVGGGLRFEAHPGCACVASPIVKGVADRFPIPTGAALFAAKTAQEQDAAVGPEAAALLRDGKADLKDFVAHSPLDSDQPSFLTQRPVQDVAT